MRVLERRARAPGDRDLAEELQQHAERWLVRWDRLDHKELRNEPITMEDLEL